MKLVQHTATLFEYDGPQVFEARDRIGGHYIAVALKSDGDKQQYLVAGTTPEQLRRFRCGTVDLRSLLVDPNCEEWYLSSSDSLEEPFAIEPQMKDAIDEDFLPDPDFFLNNYFAESDVLAEAKARNNLVVQITAEPPEAADGHRMKVTTFVGLLGLIQSLVSHAFRAALKENKVRQKQTVINASHLDVVVPATEGSFQVLLESSAPSDLLGPNTSLSFALKTIDILFVHATSPEETLNTVQNYRGHVAGSYLKLLQFLTTHDTGISYAWAEPRGNKSHSSGVSLDAAKLLVETLAEVRNLGNEDVAIIGEIDRVNRRQRTWGLLTEEGYISGSVSDEGPDLNGLKVGARYEFRCLEVIEDVSVAGQEIRKLYLNEFVPV